MSVSERICTRLYPDDEIGMKSQNKKHFASQQTASADSTDRHIFSFAFFPVRHPCKKQFGVNLEFSSGEISLILPDAMTQAQLS